MAVTCDILIVGGGVMGTSIAFALAQRGVGRVVLLEKSFLGAGSSGKSGAIVRQHYSNALTVAMARQSLRVFEEFPDVVGGPAVFTRTGMVLIVNERDRPGLEANMTLQRGLGVDVRLVSGDELMDIDSNARLDEGELAAFESEAGYVEAVQVVASYADAARRARARRHVRHEPLVPCALLAHHEHRLAHAFHLRQHALDLAELDPVAAQLHLVVHAAQALELAHPGALDAALLHIAASSSHV